MKRVLFCLSISLFLWGDIYSQKIDNFHFSVDIAYGFNIKNIMKGGLGDNIEIPTQSASAIASLRLGFGKYFNNNKWYTGIMAGLDGNDAPVYNLFVLYLEGGYKITNGKSPIYVVAKGGWLPELSEEFDKGSGFQLGIEKKFSLRRMRISPQVYYDRKKVNTSGSAFSDFVVLNSIVFGINFEF